MSKLTVFAKSLMLIGMVALVPFAFLYSSFAWGFVCMKTWNWFVQPIFTTLPVLAYFQAVGLMTFVGLVIWHHQPTKTIKSEYAEPTNFTVASGILTPWMALLTAWFVHLVL